MYLFRLFNSRKSTDPLDYVYGLLGLLNVEELPRSLLPNYKLDYASVCQDYAQYIIENTNDLEIIETYRSDFQPPLPASWVPDVRYNRINVSDEDEPSTNFVKFSTDGARLTVKGVRIGKLLNCSCTDCPRYDEASCLRYRSTVHLSCVEETLLKRSAQIKGKTIDEVFSEWLHNQLAEGVWGQQLLGHEPQTMNDLLQRYAEASKDIPKELLDILELLPSNELPRIYDLAYCSGRQSVILHSVHWLAKRNYCLLETGELGVCDLKNACDGVAHGKEDEVWALNGCHYLSILSRAENGYRYRGLIRTRKSCKYEEGTCVRGRSANAGLLNQESEGQTPTSGPEVGTSTSSQASPSGASMSEEHEMLDSFFQGQAESCIHSEYTLNKAFFSSHALNTLTLV